MSVVVGRMKTKGDWEVDVVRKEIGMQGNMYQGALPSEYRRAATTPQ